jgi:hypothetical protein
MAAHNAEAKNLPGMISDDENEKAVDEKDREKLREKIRAFRHKNPRSPVARKLNSVWTDQGSQLQRSIDS